jgi:DNA ligase-associated metallophosphoesterase
MEIELLHNHFTLLPQRAIYWQEQSALILSDTHFGKTAHFRKAGIAIPDHSFHSDMEVMDKLVSAFAPASLIIVGDMFHSHYNKEVDHFAAWRDKHRQLDILLAKGNHDILHRDVFRELHIHAEPSFTIGDFIFSHELCRDDSQFCFNGHIHPGVRMTGPARQQLKFPCFHFSDMSCTLPAFSRFTGLAIIDPLPDDDVFMIVGDEVMRH